GGGAGRHEQPPAGTRTVVADPVAMRHRATDGRHPLSPGDTMTSAGRDTSRLEQPPIGAAVTPSPALDHIALTVPNLDDLVDRLTTAFGMVARFRFDHVAVVVDPGSDFKLELSTSDDGEVHLRHLGFRTDDVDAAH